MELFSTVTVILVFLGLIGPGILTRNNSECILSVTKSRLEIASQILESARQNLPTDLNELCKKHFNCTECKNRTHYVKPMDCSDIYLAGERRDGIYDIWPQNRLSKGPISVYCDLESNGGGWTVVQRRGDYKSAEDYFYQGWNAYREGFGDMLKDFWIGNENLFALTNQRPYELRVNLSDWEGNSTYATYDEFWVADELHNYTLHVKGYRGTAGDSLKRHDGCGFFTKDRDNKYNCAVERKGSWWYAGCTDSNLNGLYKREKSTTPWEIVCWEKFRGSYYSLKDTVMKVRPANLGGRPPS